MRAVQIDWRTALVYVTREPFWKQRIAVGGALMLAVPPVGRMLRFSSYPVISHVVLRVLARADRIERIPRRAAQLQQVPT